MRAAGMHADPRQIVVQVGDIHPHDPGGLPFQPYVHRIAVGHGGQFLDGFFLRHALVDGLLHISLPLEDVLALFIQVGLVTDRAMAMSSSHSDQAQPSWHARPNGESCGES